MRITLTSWSPFIGGAEVAIERLALGLIEAGHEVLLVVGTEGEALARFRAAGIRCELVPQRFTDKLTWLNYRKSRNQLVDLLRREQPDLVHSNDLTTHQLTADAARRLGVPRVCHHRWVFDGGAIDWMNKFGAERHLFVSRALKNSLCEASENLAASECHVVYDGLPLPPIPSDADRQAAREELGLPVEKQIVLFAGQIIERKGVADLLRGWAALAPRWQDRAELFIIGDDLEKQGAYRREMEQLADELPAPARFMGFQKNVDRWLAAADVVTVPSHVEPLGNATLEAMAQARPVIGGNVGGVPEMVLHETTGLLIPPKSPADLGQALERLLSQPEFARQLGAAARRRGEAMFSIEAHVNAVLAEYQQVLSGVAVG